MRRHAPSHVFLFTTFEKHIGQGVVVGQKGEDRSLKDVSENDEMPRCYCRKKMRLRSDGWKRCYRCGKQVMGLALRAELGRRSMMEDFPQHYTMDADAPVVQPTFASRLKVTWRSDP